MDTPANQNESHRALLRHRVENIPRKLSRLHIWSHNDNIIHFGCSFQFVEYSCIHKEKPDFIFQCPIHEFGHLWLDRINSGYTILVVFSQTRNRSEFKRSFHRKPLLSHPVAFIFQCIGFTYDDIGYMEVHRGHLSFEGKKMVQLEEYLCRYSRSLRVLHTLRGENFTVLYQRCRKHFTQK